MDFILGTTDKTNLILWKLYNSNLFEVHERMSDLKLLDITIKVYSDSVLVSEY